MTQEAFQKAILEGIPDVLPEPRPYDPDINHAPNRKQILTDTEKILAIKNALRYFPKKHHAILAKEFAEELKETGRIYMYRFRPPIACTRARLKHTHTDPSKRPRSCS